MQDRSASRIYSDSPEYRAHANDCRFDDADGSGEALTHDAANGKRDLSEAVLQPQNWLRCDRCSCWRFVSAQCVSSLGGEEFFDVRETDLDWGCWMSGATARYAQVQALHGCEQSYEDRGGDELGCVEGKCAEQK